MQISQILKCAAIGLLLLAGTSYSLSSQETGVIRENEFGEKIIVYPDGTYKYFNSNEEVSPTQDKSGQAYPIFTGTIEPLDGQVVVSEQDLYKVAIRRTQLARDAADIAQRRANEAMRNRSLLEDQLRRLSSNDLEQRKMLERQLAAARRTEQTTASEVMQARGMDVREQAMVEKGGFVEAFNERQRSRRQLTETSLARQTVADLSYSSVIPLVDNTIAAGNPANDLLLHPPQRGCKFGYEGQDNSTQQWRRDLEKQLLFTYTDERLRPYLKEKEYLSCRGHLSSVGGYRFLTLEFTFAYPNAREAYGFIERGSVLTIKLLNGGFVNLQSGRMDQGSYDTVKEELTYNVYYPVDRGQLNLLKGSEVDFIRVFWSNGYEEYEVFQLDFFQHQLRCLGD